MTALDIMVLLVIGLAAILGWRRGLVCEALSMLGLVVAIVAVRLFHAPVADMLTGVIGTEGGAAVLAYALVFGLTSLVGRYAAQKMGERSRSSFIGPVDRVLGFGFGAVKGLLVSTVVFVGFAMVYDTLYGQDAPRPDWMRSSHTYPLLNASGRAMSEWLAERRAHGGLLGGDPA